MHLSPEGAGLRAREWTVPIITENMIHNVTSHVGSSPITIETGKLAKLADGAVTVRSGETIVLVT
ncbi:MAG: hypothetical protein EOP84_09280, partial [Verrucomicrobiaceae bacterium]